MCIRDSAQVVPDHRLHEGVGVVAVAEFDDELRRITAGGEIVWTSPLASGAVESPTIGVGADGVYVAVRGDEASSRWLRALSHAGAVRWTVALDASVRVEALCDVATTTLALEMAQYSSRRCASFRMNAQIR